MSIQTITVSGNLGRFTIDQQLTSMADIVEYYRLAYSEGRDEGEAELSLTDDEVFKIVQSVPNTDKPDDDDIERDTLLANANAAKVTDEGTSDDTDILSGADDDEGDDTEDATDDTPNVSDKTPDTAAAPTVAVASEVKSRAIRIANALQDAPGFMSELRSDMDAGEKVKRAPLMLMLIVRSAFKREDMIGWPTPGTTYKKNDNNPDKLQISVRDPESGEWKPKVVGFYDLVFSALDEGRRLDQKIEAIRKRKTDASSPYKGMDDAVAISEKKAAEARRTQGRTLLRRAVALHMQFEAVKSYLPELHCYYITQPNPKDKSKRIPSNSTYPIVVQTREGTKLAPGSDPDAGTEKKSGTYSITQFLGFKVKDALDTAKVAEKGGVWEAFTGSSGKGPDDPNEEGKALDIDAVVDGLGLEAHWFEVDGNSALLRKRMRGDINVMMSVCSLSLELQPLYAEFKHVYDAAQAADNAETPEEKERQLGRARAMLANKKTTKAKAA